MPYNKDVRRMRRAAKRRGLHLSSGRTRGTTWPDKSSGHRLTEVDGNWIFAGENYDLTLADVGKLLREIQPVNEKRGEVL